MKANVRTLGEIATALGAELRGDPEIRIHQVRSLHRAGEGDLTFLSDGRPPPPADELTATAIIVGRDVPTDSFPGQTALLRTENAYEGFALALRLIYSEPVVTFDGIDASAQVDSSAQIAPGARLAPEVVVGPGTSIGPGCILHPGVTVGGNCELGEDVILYPRVVLYPGTRIGDRSILHAGTVIGCDGFDYVRGENAALKIPHVGGVRIGRDVEIGASCTVDRGVLEDSVIGDGSKIDNLVHLGHNIQLGRGCIIAAQTGIAGSCEIGDGVVIAGQVGVAGHLKIGDRAQIGAKSGVRKDIPPDTQYLGYPAEEIQHARRTYAILHRLPDFKRQLDALAAAVKRLVDPK